MTPSERLTMFVLGFVLAVPPGLIGYIMFYIFEKGPVDELQMRKKDEVQGEAPSEDLRSCDNVVVYLWPSKD